MSSSYDNRRPRGHSRTCQAVAQTVSDVGRQRRRDSHAEQPTRQRGNGVARRAESSITIEVV